MKILLAFLLSLLIFVPGALAQDTSRSFGALEVVSAGRPLRPNAEQELTVKFWLQQLMLSALYRNAVLEADLAAWQERVTAQSRIHCRYPSPASLAMPERQMITFDEVLLPLDTDAYPSYIFVKRGDAVMRLAKYDPWVFHKLISEAGLPVNERLRKGVDRGLF